MEFVGKAGESGGGMFVVSILFNAEDVFDLTHLTILSQKMDLFLDSSLRSAQSSGQSGSSYA